MDIRSKEFKKLAAKWKKKLAASGFNDIEQDELYLKNPSWGFLDRRDSHEVQMRAKQEYYYLAEHFLTEHKFETEFDRTIWKLHSEAISITDIVKHLATKRVIVGRSFVHEKLKKLVKAMKAGTSTNE